MMHTSHDCGSVYLHYTMVYNASQFYYICLSIYAAIAYISTPVSVHVFVIIYTLVYFEWTASTLCYSYTNSMSRDLYAQLLVQWRTSLIETFY